MATPNMNMTVPVVSTTVGPDYASDINADLNIIDAHDHSPGYGAQIVSGSININGDLTFAGYSATHLVAAAFNSQSSPLSSALLNRVYASGGELYFNDGSGNQVKITVAGNVNVGSVGAITGMGGTTASVVYSNVTKKFTFSQDSNYSAHLSTASVIIHKGAGASESGITLASPTLSGSYTVTFPTAAPGSTMPVQMDSSGTLSAAQITTAQITDAAVTPVKMGATSSTASSAGSTSYTTVGSYAAISGLTLSITTYGRPVLVRFQEGADTNASTIEGYVRLSNSGANTTNAKIAFSSDGGTTKVAASGLSVVAGNAVVGNYYPASQFGALLDLAAGTYTIAAYWTITSVGAGTGTIATQNVKLVAKEL